MEYPGFAGPSSPSRSVLADAEETINWRLQTLPSPNAPVQKALYPVHGRQLWGSGLQDGPCRGAFGQDGHFYMVGGKRFHEMNADGVPIHALDMADWDGQLCTLSSNGDGGGQIFITSGNAGYIWDVLAFTLTKVLTRARFGAMIDSFFLALDVDTSTLQISDSYNGLVWDPTQIIQRSTAGDRWKSMIVGPGGGEIFLFGDRTSDIFYNKGTSPIPFAPVTSAKIEHGIEAPFSVAWLNGPVWLAQDAHGARTVRRAKGYDPQKISDDALDDALANYSTVADAEGDVFREDGHDMYALHIPSQGVTHVFDDTEGVWHKRQFWDTGTGRYKVDRARFHNYIFGRMVIGDRETANVYETSDAFGLDVDGAAIRRLRRTAGLKHERRMLFFSSFELYLEGGMGVATGQGSDPELLWRASKDGGKTFGGWRRKKTGKGGKFLQRVKFNLVGRARDRVDEIVVTDPVPWRILGAVLEPQGASPTGSV